MSSNFHLYLTDWLGYMTSISGDICTQINSIFRMCYRLKKLTTESKPSKGVKVIETSIESLLKEIDDYLEISK